MPYYKKKGEISMEINNVNANQTQQIKWQQLTAKEILKYKDDGEQVPTEFQKWAAAVSAAINIQDDVTYEMVNGETDIAALEKALGTGQEKEVQEPPKLFAPENPQQNQPLPTLTREQIQAGQTPPLFSPQEQNVPLFNQPNETGEVNSTENINPELQPVEDIENENEQDQSVINQQEEEQKSLIAPEKEQEEKEGITLADQDLLTDPEEILKRKLKKGETI